MSMLDSYQGKVSAIKKSMSSLFVYGMEKLVLWYSDENNQKLVLWKIQEVVYCEQKAPG